MPPRFRLSMHISGNRDAGGPMSAPSSRIATEACSDLCHDNRTQSMPLGCTAFLSCPSDIPSICLRVSLPLDPRNSSLVEMTLTLPS